MRVIALIDDPGVIRHILEHLGLWAPDAIERAPPLAPKAPVKRRRAPPSAEHGE
jgi:hypothetical protein